MPYYIKSAFPHSIARVQPQPFYAFGTFDSKQTPTKLLVTQVALTTNVATVTAKLISGPPPVVGAVMGVRATTANPSVFNVDPTVVTAVSGGTNGVYTISYAVTNANITAVADSGEVAVLPYETPEAIAIGASIPLALTFDTAESDGSRCVSAEVNFTTIPTACTVVLQVADVDQDSRYYTVCQPGTTTPIVVASVAASAVTQAGQQFPFVMGRFIRLAVTALTGTGDFVATIFV